MFLTSPIYTGGTFRVEPADLASHISWMANVNSKLSAGSNWTMEVGHNGNGNIAVSSCSLSRTLKSRYHPGLPLTREFEAKANDFLELRCYRSISQPILWFRSNILHPTTRPHRRNTRIRQTPRNRNVPLAHQTRQLFLHHILHSSRPSTKLVGSTSKPRCIHAHLPHFHPRSSRLRHLFRCHERD